MRLKALRPSDLTFEQQALYAAVNSGPRGPVHVAEDGSLLGPFNAMLHNPIVGGPLQQLGAALRYGGLLPDAARELAILTVAAAHESEFEWHAHVPIAEGCGVSRERIEEIRQRKRPVLEDDLEQAVVDVTTLLLEKHDLSDEEYEAATRCIGVPELVELTTLVGYYGLLALQMQLFRVSLPPGASPSFSALESLT